MTGPQLAEMARGLLAGSRPVSQTEAREHQITARAVGHDEALALWSRLRWRSLQVPHDDAAKEDNRYRSRKQWRDRVAAGNCGNCGKVRDGASEARCSACHEEHLESAHKPR